MRDRERGWEPIFSVFGQNSKDREADKRFHWKTLGAAVVVTAAAAAASPFAGTKARPRKEKSGREGERRGERTEGMKGALSRGQQSLLSQRKRRQKEEEGERRTDSRDDACDTRKRGANDGTTAIVTAAAATASAATPATPASPPHVSSPFRVSVSVCSLLSLSSVYMCSDVVLRSFRSQDRSCDCCRFLLQPLLPFFYVYSHSLAAAAVASQTPLHLICSSGCRTRAAVSERKKR